MIKRANFYEALMIGHKQGLSVFKHADNDIRITPGVVHVSDGIANRLLTIPVEITLSSEVLGAGSETYASLLTTNTDTWTYITLDGRGSIRLRLSTDAGTKNDPDVRPADSFFLWSGFQTLKGSFYYSSSERIIGVINRQSDSDWRVVQGYSSFLEQVPTGTIISSGAATTVLEGFLYCDGTEYSTSAWSKLYATIGTTWGSGVGTFKVPNGKAVCLTGVGDQTIGTRAKSGPAIGTVEEDRFQGHWHQMRNGDTQSLSASGYNFARNEGANTAASVMRVAEAITDGVNGAPRVGAWTRPNQIGVHFFVRF